MICTATEKVCTENPFVTAMHWDLSNAHDERQVIPFGPDECNEYAEHDEGLGMGNFKPDELPCHHPQCLCVQWAVIPDSLENIGARIGAWASGEPDELLDEWYDKYGSQNPNGDPREIILRGNGGAAQAQENRDSPLQNNAGRGIIKTNGGFYKESDDPMFKAFGRAEDSNPIELAELQARLSAIGVSIERHSEEGAAIAYQSIRLGAPGTISVTPNISYSAWLHEAQHAFDDRDAGWNGAIAAWDVEEHIRREIRAYQVEIDLANAYGRPDIAKLLEQNRDNEIEAIMERDERYVEENKLYNDD